jgi:proteasome assembly chaperone (PAC2) family protein
VNCLYAWQSAWWFSLWIVADLQEEVSLKNPSMVVSVSTGLPQYRAMYSQARELADYMLRKMEFETIGTVRSSSFPPEVIVREEGVAALPQCTFSLHRGARDLVLFAGDMSPVDDQYEFSNALLGWAKKLGVKELFSVGARWAESPANPESDPELWGFASDAQGVESLRAQGVKIMGEEPAPFFSSLVVGLAGQAGIRGFKVSVDHGEPSPHVRSVGKMLRALSGLAGFEVDLGELEASPAKPSATGESTIYH